MINLGIVTAKNSYQQMKDLEAHLSNKCSIKWLVYASLDELLALYGEQESELDAVLFSGPLPLNILMNAGIEMAIAKSGMLMCTGSLSMLL